MPCTKITVFNSTSCEDWTPVEDSSHWGFKVCNSPFCIRGAVTGFGKSERLANEGYGLPPTNLLISLLPAPQLDVKRIIWRALKCRNKKQEVRRKKQIEQVKLEGKSLDIRDWKMFTPSLPGRGRGWDSCPPPSSCPQESRRNWCFT